jgi:hypothetical protein
MSLTGTANCLTFLKNAIFQSNWVGWFWHVPYERKICWYIAFGDSRKLDIPILKYRFIVAQAIYFRIELMLDSFFQVSNCWNEYAHALVWLSIQSRFKTHFSLTVIWHWYGFSHCKFICSPSNLVDIFKVHWQYTSSRLFQFSTIDEFHYLHPLCVYFKVSWHRQVWIFTEFCMNFFLENI